MATPKAPIIRTIADSSKQEQITIEIIRKRTITKRSKMRLRHPRIMLITPSSKRVAIRALLIA